MSDSSAPLPQSVPQGYREVVLDVSGLTQAGRQKELEKLKGQYEAKGWLYQGYQDEALVGKARFLVPPSEARKRELLKVVGGGCAVALLGLVIYAVVTDDGRNSRHRPTQDSSDGTVQEVVDYLKANLKDPKSLEVIEWSPMKEQSPGYAVRCKYRAKNSFGGYNIENRVFYMNPEGKVLHTEER